MEQKSLRVLDTNKTFFSKITSTITKMLVPTRISINSMMISMKRSSLIKSYSNYIIADAEKSDKKESFLQKNGTATEFEKDALGKYYFVVSLKEKQYVEYKYKKQEYLLKVDYESVTNLKKENIIEKYNKFYVQKMDSLYKGLLKNYSVQLADTKVNSVDNIYNKIFTALENYITDILPIKLRTADKKEYENILEDYEKYESMLVGKLDERDKIRQRVVLLGLSRELFTHSLPLIAAEQCYEELIKNVKSLIIDTKIKPKKNQIFELLVEVIEEYNLKLLSTKVYWDKPENKEEYKKFWNQYNEICSIENNEVRENKKQILFLKNDLKNTNNSKTFIKELRQKLIELGAIRQIKNSCKTLDGNYKKV